MENRGSPQMLLVLSGGGHPLELVVHTRRGSLPLRVSVCSAFLPLHVSVWRRLSASARVCMEAPFCVCTCLYVGAFFPVEGALLP